ncbi:hypothetical protein Srubr_75180 [Streptomyces rubradiris]|uniref:Uncharacterized protein n=1 Tax=Streptomyces rubradiris TaxID=285531 RepID=A0ABQ3RP88_STRRR|nr:hypothetical protein GCM10018792_37010 [Streptomyces rubradiris]GHI57672.1 hypothetical protein Srubr_75180 [Streptomyces rubradiris]
MEVPYPVGAVVDGAQPVGARPSRSCGGADTEPTGLLEGGDPVREPVEDLLTPAQLSPSPCRTLPAASIRRTWNPNAPDTQVPVPHSILYLEPGRTDKGDRR